MWLKERVGPERTNNDPETVMCNVNVGKELTCVDEMKFRRTGCSVSSV